MKVLFLLWSALSVSADSFFAGLSLSQNSIDFKSILFGVSGTVFCLSLLGATLGLFIPPRLTQTANIIAGLVLAIIGFYELNQTKTTALLSARENNALALSIISGLSIGVDGSVGALALTLCGYTPFIVVTYITIMHLNLLLISFMVSDKIKEFPKLEKLPSLLLISLGFYKIIDGVL